MDTKKSKSYAAKEKLRAKIGARDLSCKPYTLKGELQNYLKGELQVSFGVQASACKFKKNEKKNYGY